MGIGRTSSRCLPARDRLYSRSTRSPRASRPPTSPGPGPRRLPGKGIALPEWFSRPPRRLDPQRTSPPRFRQGLTIWFTGLSGRARDGANALVERLASTARNVSSLDGDEIQDPTSRRPRLQQGRPRRQHPNRVATSAAWSPARRERPLLRDQPHGPSATTPARRPRATSSRSSPTPDRGLRVPGRQGALRQGPERRGQRQRDGLHRVDDPYEAPLNPKSPSTRASSPSEQCVDRYREADRPR